MAFTPDPLGKAILDAIHIAEEVKFQQGSRELSLVITKLEEALMWRARSNAPAEFYPPLDEPQTNAVEEPNPPEPEPVEA